MARLTFEQCCDQVAKKYGYGGFKAWKNQHVSMFGQTQQDAIDICKEAAELLAKSAQAEAWDACTDKWKDVITDEYRYEEPKNPYKDDN